MHQELILVGAEAQPRRATQVSSKLDSTKRLESQPQRHVSNLGVCAELQIRSGLAQDRLGTRFSRLPFLAVGVGLGRC